MFILIILNLLYYHSSLSLHSILYVVLNTLIFITSIVFCSLAVKDYVLLPYKTGRLYFQVKKFCQKDIARAFFFLSLYRGVLTSSQLAAKTLWRKGLLGIGERNSFLLRIVRMDKHLQPTKIQIKTTNHTINIPELSCE